MWPAQLLNPAAEPSQQLLQQPNLDGTLRIKQAGFRYAGILSRVDDSVAISLVKGLSTCEITSSFPVSRLSRHCLHRWYCLWR